LSSLNRISAARSASRCSLRGTVSPGIHAPVGARAPLFAQHGFNAQPESPDCARNDCGSNNLESQTLCLLDAFAPSAQMNEVSPQLDAILFLNAEGSQYGCNGL